jgi:hypothetical protein
LKPGYIREIYECKLLKIGQYGNYTSVEFVGGGEETTKSMLWNLAKQQNTTILVTGMHGRKGPKMDHTIAGSTVKFLADEAHTPICIVKDPRTREMKSDGKYRFGVCYDGSQ